MPADRPSNGSPIPLLENGITTLTPYFAPIEAGNAPCFIIFPGGGYQALAPHEGEGFTHFFHELGFHAFVLTYRLANQGYRHPAMLEDAAASVRYVRAHAEEWGIDAGRIGVIGSSAGGHLAATLATHPGGADARPDLVVLAYPVVTMKSDLAHTGSRKNLLGKDPSDELVEELSAETRVSAETPPFFIWHTVEDQIVPVEHSILLAQALRKAGVPFDLHLFESGHHGIGMPQGHVWPQALRFWLAGRGWV